MSIKKRCGYEGCNDGGGIVKVDVLLEPRAKA